MQDALNAYCPNVTEIWVAAGTYYPGSLRTDAFVMKNNLAIYGGFDGTETMLSERDWTTNITILSGDIGIPLDNTDNCYNVILNENNNLDNTAIIDGFTITSGNATGLRFGGGMLNESASPWVENCIFTNNVASAGGGMYNFNAANPMVINTTFISNQAGFLGGGMWNNNASPTITNCSFSGNSSTNNGGGVANFSSSPTITNCIFWGNSTELFNDNSSPIVSYSIVQGGFTGTDNLDSDPLFIDQPVIGLGSIGDLRLAICSPGIDAGANDSIPAAVTTDLDGNPRIFDNGIVDIGAYELQTLISNSLTLTGSQLSSETFITNGEIISSQLILPPTDIEYNSAISIEIIAPFEVQLGATLITKNDGCN